MAADGSVIIQVEFQTGSVDRGVEQIQAGCRRAGEAAASLRSQLNGAGAALASAFTPVATAVAPALSQMCSMLATAAGYVAAFYAVLAGKSYAAAGAVKASYASGIATVGRAADTAAAGVTALAGAVKVAAVSTDQFGVKTASAISGVGSAAGYAADGVRTIGKEAAKAERNLSGLDQMNLWQVRDPSSSGGGGSGGGLDIQGGGWTDLPIEELFAARVQSVAERVAGFVAAVRDASVKLRDLKVTRDLAAGLDRARTLAAALAGAAGTVREHIAAWCAGALWDGLMERMSASAALAGKLEAVCGGIGAAVSRSLGEAHGSMEGFSAGFGQWQRTLDAGSAGVGRAVSAAAKAVSDAASRQMDSLRRGTSSAFRRIREDGAGHAAGLASDVEGAYGGMTGTVAAGSSAMETDNDTSWKAMKTLLLDMAGKMQRKVVDAYDAMGEKVSAIMAQARESSGNAWAAMEGDGKTASAAIRDHADRAWKGVFEAVSGHMNETGTAVRTKWAEIGDAVKDAGADIRSSVSGAWSAAASAVTAQMNSLKSSAYGWGSDLGSQFASGIRGAVGRIASAASSAAAAVRSYLHFSVPDRGPLSDADEYGPDLVDLISRGILAKRDTAARAAQAVAEAMADGLAGGAAAERMDRLAALAAPIQALQAVPAPVMASGTVLPPRAVYGSGPALTLAGAGEQLRQLLAGTQDRTGQSVQYTFIGQIDRQVLFREVIDEAKARQGRNGKNPFFLEG